ncbi:MAG: hypothetical protein A2845_03010 [Candidatus Lloydbacteria bacterium RIFCSPHIGHO2_01_FULL_49_22]|uniref:Uncharacterized protein n=1 Tax=Candidatus Lloydbacteria bacterium RIFCSPHIGHO2_01_FULL_49_22 TaxID=1798658 RepID=A0A1G2CXL8_9BACT|nr:MAG: hypothetical protein A2845_03010 [Candidatus Lloydbacteria bacterium RIFCSPHIGHO2_01_FULL_49_22]OGZ10409.1 MAG: hypothetical protein A3C14_02705 [Candidatus Lloydbacteria bacterium RIFCSPHIGHO2_02_FULL_50_18]
MAEIKREPTGIRCKLENCEDGIIIKKTVIELAIPKSEIRMGGGPLPMQHVVTCYCNSCGTVYEPEVILKKMGSMSHP